jgi:gliding motility-associated-like protein
LDYNWRRPRKKKDSIAVEWSKPGVQEVILTGTNQYGCDTTIQKKVEVLKTPHPVVKGPDAVCAKGKGHYQLQADNIDSIHWQAQNGKLNTQADSPNATVKWTPALGGDTLIKKGIIEARVVAQNGCKTQAKNPVEIHSIQANVAPNSAKGCAPETIVFSAKGSRNASAYQWQFEKGASDRGQTGIHQFKSAGYQEVQLIVSNSVGCRDTTFADIDLSPQPKADFAFIEPDTPTAYTLNQDKLAIENRSEEARYYQWSFGDGFESQQANPRHIYQETGKYPVTLVAENENGCSDSLKKLVKVKATPHLYIPTAFSPDGDGLNDHFSVEATNVKDFEIKIYNRWGERIYKASKTDFQWDGTYKGEQVQVGTYMFVATGRSIDGQFLKQSGKLTVVK